VARQQVSSDVDDAVPLKPEDLRVLLPVPHSATARFGAAAAFLMKRIAYRAGAYAPGIQEFMWHVLTTTRYGASLEGVMSWMRENGGDMHGMGYRVQGQPVLGQRTQTILGWVKEGRGFRGAVLATEYGRLHPAEGSAFDPPHAVGVTVDRLEPTAAEDLIMVDPWPGIKNGARDRTAIPPQLEHAHRPSKYAALILYWTGWS
jgi:hypothetical protein